VKIPELGDIYERKYTYDEMKVAYLLGQYFGDSLKKLDYEDVVKIAASIFEYWKPMYNGGTEFDCKNREEEGYIQKYAERIAELVIERYKHGTLFMPPPQEM